MDLAYVAAGVLAILFPSKAISATVADWTIAVFGGFYILGGALCALGVVLRQAAPRYVGLPLMIGASAMYGSAVLIQFFRLNDGAYLFVGTLLLATAIGLFDRWTVISRSLRLVQRKERE